MCIYFLLLPVVFLFLVPFLDHQLLWCSFSCIMGPFPYISRNHPISLLNRVRVYPVFSSSSSPFGGWFPSSSAESSDGSELDSNYAA